MMDNTAMERGTLIGVKTVMSKFTASHPTDGVDEVRTIEILEPVLVWIMGIGLAIEIHCGRIFNPILIMSILQNTQYT